MNKKIGFKCLVFASLCCFLNAANARIQSPDTLQAQVVVARGLGSIINNDVAHARDDAVSDALRTGIEQALGMIMESETLVENFMLIEDRIFSKTQGYIQTYEVIQEGRLDEQLYEVTVRAVVKMANLQNDLDAIATLMRRKNMPRMMVIITENNMGQGPGIFNYFDADLNAAETTLIDRMMAKGFQFVDPATVRANLERNQAAAILEGDNAQAAALARTLGAEIIVTGKAVSTATEIEAFGAKTRSQQATVSIRAIRADTGDIIGTAQNEGRFPHINDVVGGQRAIERATEKSAAALIDRIVERWHTDVSTGTTLTLHVRGITEFDQLNNLRQSLTYMVRGLNQVVQRSWSGDYAVLEVTMTGNADDLARRLSGQKIQSAVIEVTGMTQNSVSIELIKN